MIWFTITLDFSGSGGHRLVTHTERREHFHYHQYLRNLADDIYQRMDVHPEWYLMQDTEYIYVLSELRAEIFGFLHCVGTKVDVYKALLALMKEQQHAESI